MQSNYIGDQARIFALRSNAARLGEQLNKLTKESASGEVADLGLRLQGDTVILNNLENRISLIQQYEKNSQDASVTLKWQQQVLAMANDFTSEFANEILTLPQAFDEVVVEELAQEATEKFSIIVDQLNRDVSGRYIFSGLDINERPFRSPSEVIGKMTEIANQATSAEEIFQRISIWFDAEAGEEGFDSFAYNGASNNNIRFNISEGEVVDIGISAIEPEIKNMLKGLAIAALADHVDLGGDSAEIGRLLESGAREIWNNEVNLIQRISAIGAAQEEVERGQVRNSATLSELTIARNDIRQVDLYETSSAILETESQLRNLYLLTARISSLNLADYLR
ncbi:hypothetical protein [Paracoccus onubensis]|uniref:Uncharacterized protein n=1 Tax=Paracoccus onubensis TaxID=1675788 RepID=A0A418SMP5_9RHOB|nr:hypothetical protein [Paracoccus onubensis]RJE82215.1 hypothetical protein D3P04_21020 [Paracoccus onubensis]